MTECDPDGIDLPVLYQDEFLIAIDKPGGLLVHRSAIASDVIGNAVQRVRDQIGQPVYPVHRLDRPTSGVLLFALDQDTQRRVNEQFAGHLVKKEYLAIVRGHIQEEGALDYALAGRDSEKKRVAVTQWVRKATTELDHPVGRYQTARYSLVSLLPKTGRWHQLRRHCAHLRHPIVGDTSHGDGAHNRFFRDALGIPGLFLLAQKLELTHPASGTAVRITAPPSRLFVRAVETLGWDLEAQFHGGADSDHHDD